MGKWKPAKGGRKPQAASRARQIGCIVWLVMAMALVMWLFYAVVSPK
jgi:hypothetical protein